MKSYYYLIFEIVFLVILIIISKLETEIYKYIFGLPVAGILGFLIVKSYLTLREERQYNLI